MNVDCDLSLRFAATIFILEPTTDSIQIDCTVFCWANSKERQLLISLSWSNILLPKLVGHDVHVVEFFISY